MTTKQKCPSCQQENEATATKCANCGTPLTLDTTLKTDSPTLALLPGEQDPPAATKILFFMPGKDAPIVVDAAERVMLGRRSTDGTAPTLDLSEFQGHLHGVSREHAVISQQGKRYTIQDLGSTNGTFLNEKRLAPHKPYTIQSGDYLRVGNLGIVIHFKTQVEPTPAAAPVESVAPTMRFGVEPGAPTVQFKEDDFQLAARGRTALAAGFMLTPEYLANVVMPYLLALTGIQSVIDEVQGYTRRVVLINTISADQSMAAVNVKLVGAADALRFSKEKLMPWRRQQLEAVPSSAPAAPSDTSATAEEKRPDNNSAKSDRIEPEETVRNLEAALDGADGTGVDTPVRASQKQLARELVSQFAPAQAKLDPDLYVGKLLPHFDTLAFSLLEIVTAG